MIQNHTFIYSYPPSSKIELRTLAKRNQFHLSNIRLNMDHLPTIINTTNSSIRTAYGVLNTTLKSAIMATIARHPHAVQDIGEIDNASLIVCGYNITNAASLGCFFIKPTSHDASPNLFDVLLKLFCLFAIIFGIWAYMWVIYTLYEEYNYCHHRQKYDKSHLYISHPGSQEPGSQEPGSQEPGSQEPGSQEPGSHTSSQKDAHN
jgi:hypothetical protein